MNASADKKSAEEGKADISGMSPLPHLSAIVRAFSSIYILLDYPPTRVRFVREFSPL